MKVSFLQQHKKTLIENVLIKSKEALQDAEEVVKIRPSLAQNRAYYSIFYMVLALGYLDEFTTGSHHKLLGWFNKNYIYENKIFDSQLSKIYNNLLLNRETADYDYIKKSDKEAALKDIEAAKSFVNIVEPYILERFKEIE